MFMEITAANNCCEIGPCHGNQARGWAQIGEVMINGHCGQTDSCLVGREDILVSAN